MTMQEMFDKMLSGIIKQGALGKTADGSCAYQLPDGRRCVASQLLSDEQLANVVHAGLNSSGFSSINYIFKIVPRDSAELRLVRDLQDTHDESENLTDFLEGARLVAAEYKLEWRHANAG